MFDRYPYLFADFFGMLPVGLAFLLFPQYRKDMFIATLIWLPTPLMGFFHFNYWLPVRLFGWPVGIEDFLYMIHVTPLAWLLSVAPIRRWYAVRTVQTIVLQRLLLFGAVSLSVFSVCGAVGLDWMGATIAANLSLSLFVLWREPSYWPLALSGLAFFPVFHTLEQRLWFTIWPHFTEAWNQQLIWSRLVWGVPLGEILFHISLVAFCPLGVAYVRRSQVVRRHRASDLSVPILI